MLTLLKRGIKLYKNKELNMLSSDNQFLANKSMRKAYREFLTEVCVYENEPFYTCEYSIYDVNNDRIEELIVKSGLSEADMKIIICTYKGGKVVKVGELGGGHSKICGNVDDEGLTIYYGTQGIEWIDSVKIINNKFEVSNILPKKEVDKYTELDYTFPLTYYDKSNLNIFEVAKEDNVTIDGEERTKVISFIQKGVYEGYLSENEIPVITLYNDDTFEFMCNYYTNMKVLNGTYKTDKSDYYTEYTFTVEDEILDFANIIKPTFKIKYNDITEKAEFLTAMEYKDVFGLTGDTYETYDFVIEK